MDYEERLENARKVLGLKNLPAVPKRKPGEKKRKTKPVSAFVPRKKSKNRNMSRSEYNQCGKKNRYKTESDARKYASRLSLIRGYPIRVYGPCPFCGGYHLTKTATSKTPSLQLGLKDVAKRSK